MHALYPLLALVNYLFDHAVDMTQCSGALSMLAMTTTERPLTERQISQAAQYECLPDICHVMRFSEVGKMQGPRGRKRMPALWNFCQRKVTRESAKAPRNFSPFQDRMCDMTPWLNTRHC
jgi:hypothetical protein